VEIPGQTNRIALDLWPQMSDYVGVMGKGPHVPSDSEDSPGALSAPDAAGSGSLRGTDSSAPSSEEKPFVPLKVRIKRTPEGDEEEAAAEPGVASSSEAVQVPGADASLGSRIVATLIDWMIGVGLALGVQMLNVLPLISLDSRLSLLTFAAYILTRDSLPFLQGQSVGKRAMKIQAVTSEGESLAGNWQAGALRNAVLLIPLFPVVELIVLLTRQDTPEPVLRLGDEWAKTRVINAGVEGP